MRKFTGFSDYEETIENAVEKGWTASNCFMMPSAAEMKIKSGKLYVKEITAGLLLLEDEGTFYRCCYYLRPDEEPELLELGKDAVIEFPYKGEFNVKQARQEAQILAMGFALGRRSGMMSLSSDEAAHAFHLGGIPVPEDAIPEDTDEILGLLNSVFNPLYSFIPSADELRYKLSRKMLWVIRREGRIAAVLNSSTDTRSASIDHVCAAPDFRGMGYGSILIAHYHEIYRENVKKFQHWVDLDNEPAIRMYQKFGYKFEAKKANEYILIKQK